MSFAAQISAFSLRGKARLQQTRKAITIKLFSAVVKDTPVLTGRLRGNWQFSEVAPTVGEIQGVRSEAETVQLIQLGTLETDGSQPLFLTNNLPYAARIEFDGWSKQNDGKGMVRINVNRFNGILNLNSEVLK